MNRDTNLIINLKRAFSLKSKSFVEVNQPTQLFPSGKIFQIGSLTSKIKRLFSGGGGGGLEVSVKKQENLFENLLIYKALPFPPP